MHQVQVQQWHWQKSVSRRQPIVVLHLAFAMAKLYPVLFWVYQVQVHYCHWPEAASRPPANGCVAPGFCYGKIIPGIILGLPSPGGALSLARGSQPTGGQWHCCTWLLVRQNYTRYYSGSTQSRCTTAISQRRPADHQPMAVLHLSSDMEK